MTAQTTEQRLHSMVEAAARRTPEATAVISADRTLSYRELDQMAQHNAIGLRDRGAGKGKLVAIVMRRGWQQVVAALAVMKTGAAYLPIDPDLPDERIRQILELGGCEQVITQVSDELADGPPLADVASTDLAYVICTSGSTGVPKGVMIEHASAANTLRGLNERFAVGPGDRMLGLSSFSFDPSVYDTFGTLAAGATLVLPDPDRARDPAHWMELIARHNVTLWISVPSLMVMLTTWCAESAMESALPLRAAILGGEVIPADLPQRAFRFAPDLALVNVYGPTEASICSTAYDIGRETTTITCGTALPGHGVHIVDGEICLSGAGLFRGYWGDQEGTRQAFITHPETGERLYRTGDQGRLGADGSLEFLGRNDHQVKVHGYRIELGEIEAVLSQSDQVSQAYAITIGSPPTGLAAFVVPRHESTLDVGALKDLLAARLPSYMVPEAVYPLQTVPLTANGKVDRRALMAARPVPDAEPPRDGLEQQIAAVVADILGRPVHSRTGSFAELGGNSLMASQLVARLRRIFGVDLPASFAFAHPSIEQMAKALAEPLGPPTPAPMRKTRRIRTTPLSYGQEQVWFLDQLVGGNRAYHAQSSVRFRGAIRPELLQQALNQLVARHEILRTTFQDSGYGPVQVVHPPSAVPLPITDLRSTPDKAVAAIIRSEADHKFDLQHGPLIRWRLIQVADDECVIVQTEHHLVHDGWSVAVQWREVEELYRAGCAGREPELPELPIQFGDFVEWQRRTYSGTRREDARNYWRERLSGVRPYDLAVAKPRPPKQTFNGAARRINVDTELYDRLRRFSQAQGVSLFTTMFAAFSVVLHRYSGENDLCIGSWLANRDHEATGALIGMLVNMVALRSTITDDTTFEDLLQQTRQDLHDALRFQYAPFDDVVRQLPIPRDPSRNPLIQACFSFHDSPVPDFTWPHAQGAFSEHHNGSAKFDLNIVVIPRAEQRRNITGPLAESEHLTLIWEYNTDLFDDETARRMADHSAGARRDMRPPWTVDRRHLDAVRRGPRRGRAAQHIGDR